MTKLLTLSLTSTKQRKVKENVQKFISLVNFTSEVCKLKIYTFCAP